MIDGFSLPSNVTQSHHWFKVYIFKPVTSIIWAHRSSLSNLLNIINSSAIVSKQEYSSHLEVLIFILEIRRGSGSDVTFLTSYKTPALVTDYIFNANYRIVSTVVLLFERLVYYLKDHCLLLLLRTPFLTMEGLNSTTALYVTWS